MHAQPLTDSGTLPEGSGTPPEVRITAAEAAELVGVSARTIRDAGTAGKISVEDIERGGRDVGGYLPSEVRARWGAPEPPPEPSGSPPEPSGTLPEPSSREVEGLRREVAEREKRIAVLEERADGFRSRAEAAEARASDAERERLTLARRVGEQDAAIAASEKRLLELAAAQGDPLELAEAKARYEIGKEQADRSRDLAEKWADERVSLLWKACAALGAVTLSAIGFGWHSWNARKLQEGLTSIESRRADMVGELVESSTRDMADALSRATSAEAAQLAAERRTAALVEELERIRQREAAEDAVREWGPRALAAALRALPGL